MIKRINKGIKIALAAILCCGCPTFHSAQQIEHSLDEIIPNFQKLVTASYQEKIYLHTDKSIYLTGETIWFKAYCVESSTHRLSSLSKVLNINLTDKRGKSIEQTRIKLTGGTGKGQIFVSSTLVSGQYSLKAYTSWMRNFDDDFIFDIDLTIINSSAPERQEYSTGQDDSLIVHFFAEGGDLVYGIKSKIAIKATDSYGYGQQVRGGIYDNDQKKVIQFSTSEYGLGSISLLPERNKYYHAIVTRDQGEDQTVDIPKPKLIGYVISVKPVEEDLFDVMVRSNSAPDELVYLIVHTRGTLKLVEHQRLTEGTTHFSIPKKSLADGISHVTLMNSSFLPVCERLIFKFPEKDSYIRLETDKSSYATRAKVSVTIQGEHLEKGAVPSNLSLSVYNYDENLKSDNGSIVSNLLLTSDLKGHIENPGHYFDSHNESKAEELDVLLLTHGWRRFEWDDVISGAETKTRYPPEIHSPLMAGRVTSSRFEKKFKSVFSGFPGEFPILNSAELDSEGGFYFEVPFRMKNERVIFWSLNDTLISDEVQLDSPFILSSEAGKKGKSIDPNLKVYIEHNNANIQINHAYLNQTRVTGIQDSSTEVTTPFYGRPDAQYRLDNYTRFVEMEEVFVEYIRAAVIRRRANKSSFHVVNENKLDLPALVLLDGVPINDADYMLDFDPLKVRRIDVVKDYYQIGNHEFAGILNFITSEGDLAGTPLPTYIVEKLYVGLQTPREFYSPNYSNKEYTESRVPDFRNVLLWEPFINMGHSGTTTIEFFTSDDNGNYIIDIQGVSNNGTLLHVESRLKVNREF